MDFAFATVAFNGGSSQHHSSHNSSTNSGEQPTRSSDNAADVMERREPRRVASSVYSRSFNHETASTYWSAEGPPAINQRLAQRQQSAAEPTSPRVTPRMINPATHPAPGGDFREEQAQIDDMIQSLAHDDDHEGDANVFLQEHHDREHDPSADLHSPMISTPETARQGRRDFSDRSLKSLVSAKATLELLENIVRVTWNGNLQEKLCEVALAIHKDLRGCFHKSPVTYETATRVTHLVTEINKIIESWRMQMRALEHAIGLIDVKRDTPNFMELHKDLHGTEIKKFRLMLSPIPTQMGAECNSKIASLTFKLFVDEVRAPFQQAMDGNGNPSPAEKIITSYFNQLERQFIEARETAERLQLSTLACWEQWTEMSQEIARQAALMQSNSPAAVALRAKGAVSRVFHQGMHRSQTKKTSHTPRSASGRVQISQPLARIEPRPGAVRDTVVIIPVHPLDACRELDAAELRRIRQKIASDPSTPRTPRERTHELSVAETSNHASPASPRVQDDLSTKLTRPTHNQPEYGHPAYSRYDDGEMEYDDPFVHFDEVADRQAAHETLEYYHHQPDAPSLSDQFTYHSNPFTRSRTSSFSDESRENPYVENDGRNKNPNAKFFANFPQFAADHQSRIAAAEEDKNLHDDGFRSRHHHHRRRASSQPARPLIEGAPYFDILTAFYKMDPEKPDAELDPELNEVWHRAMALRRLEGGPPAERYGFFKPTPAMRAVQKNYERKAERDIQEHEKARRDMEALRHEEHVLKKEIEDVHRLRAQKELILRGYGGGGGGAAAVTEQVHEKVALRKSASVAGSSGASGHTKLLRKSVSVSGHSGPSRGVSRQSDNNAFVGAAGGSGVYGQSQPYSSEHVRSEQGQQQQQLLLQPQQPPLERFSGVFRDSEGLLVEGNMRDGYRYVESYGTGEESLFNHYARLDSIGYEHDQNGNDGYENEYAYGGNEGGGYGYRESLDPLFQPRTFQDFDDSDLFVDSDPEMYGSDEEEPWRRI
ncbi:hypothetical protein DIS24_g1502 [Lasiodiplodia hormozganensis]|uniref:Uncharacterized protein n=1 Tax=Lasiodiplodia hormozganensis TaxID=869390 RepID=A0AA40D6B4_9PEZI|nr:hypothetical protein DIS24_g1502 [Lasiodiplodia hormozganensis]